MNVSCAPSDLLVFCHLRWDFVFQRPQHLMSRFVSHRRVYFIEEPHLDKVTHPKIELRQTQEGVTVVAARVPETFTHEQQMQTQKNLLDRLLEDEMIENYSAWYYTPMALHFSSHLNAEITIYDCMDELSKFKGAPQALIHQESELLQKADLVFTGGHSLYEAKKDRHNNIHPFPSAIDAAHFAQARTQQPDPDDQKDIPFPRLGFVGVIDERMDIDLLAKMAERRPQWQFIMIGPVVKIDPATLPQRPNIHYLGMKKYAELPAYLANWNCALMPFAKNEATRFISPTKTPEYLAAGLPVISTSIRDVVHPYGVQKLVAIADDADTFIAAAENIFQTFDKSTHWPRHDEFLQHISWDETWGKMAALEYELYRKKIDQKFSKMYGVLE
ncbi:glycosyltransferase family 1 protein [Bdellovibrio bacteriovorus]|uniref:glycosyltransferase family 1 protein n=1 Tax=Bdellovibrio bacteriovorus TaxID=959 RepID=UPI0035A65F20